MVKTLEKRYHRPELMRQSYLTEIHNIKPALRDPPDPRDQRRFYDQSFTLLQKVKRCGMDINHMSIRQTLLSKLSSKAQERVLQALKTLPEEERTTDKVLESLEDFVQDLEHSSALTEISKKYNRSVTPAPMPPHRTYAAVCKGDCGSRSESEASGERYTETEYVNAVYRTPVGSRDRRSYTPKPTNERTGKGPVNRQRRRPDRCMFCQKRGRTSMGAAEGRFPKREAPKTKTNYRQTYKVTDEQGFDSRAGSPEDTEGSLSSRTDCEGVEFSDSDSVYGVAARRADEETHVHMAGADERTILQCVQAEVTNPETHEYAMTRIFLDTGSSQTFINRSLAKRLGLRLGLPRPTTVLTFGRKRTNADATDDLTAYMPMVEPGEVEKVLQQPDRPVTIVKAQPEILLGLDYMHLLGVTPRKPRLENGFCVYDTEVGPILAGQGKVANPETFKARTNFCFRVQPTEAEESLPEVKTPTETTTPKFSTEILTPKHSEMLTLAEKILSLEGLGIKPEEVVCNEEYVLDNFRKNLKRLPDGRYEVRFPWLSQILEMVEVIRKSPAPKHELTWASVLPTNKRGAMARLKSVWPELAKHPEGLEQFNDNFVSLLDRDMMEEVPTDGAEDHLLHYLPTGPVWREDKPTKLRVVVDASARADRGSRCLNDCLHPGPSLLENLVGIQLRSRLHPILLLGDVEKAFLQLSLAEEDRDVTRVLWLKDYRKPPTPDNIRELRYKRVPFGISSSPFLLFATIRRHLKASGSRYADEYARNMYSDNLFLFADSQQEAVEKYTETKKIFTEMKMNIREFLSNDAS
ncbi:Zinc knuckle family protein, partial [Aphelenchoides avenae]